MLLFPNPKNFESPPGFFKRWFFIPVFWLALTTLVLALVAFFVLGFLGIIWKIIEPLFRDYVPREFVWVLLFVVVVLLLARDDKR